MWIFMWMMFYAVVQGLNIVEDNQDCLDGQQEASNVDPRQYFRCVWGTWRTLYCDRGSTYNPMSRSCEGQGVVEDVKICRDGQQQASHVDPRQYFRCVQGTWRTMLCDMGWTYNPNSRSCEGNSIEEDAQDCRDGQHEVSKADPRQYFRCVRGIWRTLFCDKGWSYNSISRSCQVLSILQSNPSSPQLSSCDPPDECPFGANFPDNCDCRRFYRCAQGGAVHMHCPVRTAWNPETGVCDSPHKVELCKTLSSKITPSPPKPPNCDPPEYCPLGLYYPDNCDCRRFYQCDHGGAVHKECGPGTAWNSKIGTCDYIYKVKLCKTLSSKITPSPPKPPNCDPPEYCPLGLYYPDTCDCRRFYQCGHGGAVHKECGPGTAWNSKIGTCDYIYKVKLCKTLSSKTTQGLQTTTSDISSSTTESTEVSSPTTFAVTTSPQIYSYEPR